jgi:hypothetical protein
MDIDQYINVSISEKSKKILKIGLWGVYGIVRWTHAMWAINPYLYAILRYLYWCMILGCYWIISVPD